MSIVSDGARACQASHARSLRSRGICRRRASVAATITFWQLRAAGAATSCRGVPLGLATDLKRGLKGLRRSVRRRWIGRSRFGGCREPERADLRVARALHARDQSGRARNETWAPSELETTWQTIPRKKQASVARASASSSCATRNSRVAKSNPSPMLGDFGASSTRSTP